MKDISIGMTYVYTNFLRIMKSISSNYHIIFVGRGYVPDLCVVWGIEWAFEKGKYKTEANEWYKDMKEVTGLEYRYASLEDFQRYFKCKELEKEKCNDKGLEFPMICSYPPCDTCVTNISGNYLKRIILNFL